MKLRLCYVLLHLCTFVAAQRTFLDSPANLQLYRGFRNWIYRAFGRTGEEGGRLFNNARSQRRIQDRIPDDTPFPCNVTGGRSSEVPESVHRLRPGDIDVIAAMGDSLTAGAGIFGTNLIHITIENRGVTAPAGGQGTWRDYLTLPNILKEFNPKLIGYALGDALTSHSASQLNVAETGAMSTDMPYMAKFLVDRIQNDPRIDVKKHWKLIFMSIGSNDFCSNLCIAPSAESFLNEHKNDVVKALRILRDNLPRTIVAVSPPPHLKALVDTRGGRDSFMCYLTTNTECPCLFGLAHRSRRLEYYDVIRRWQELDQEICDYPEFQSNDFLTLFLPTLRNSNIPLADDGFSDMSYLSPDCFHVTQKANALFANGLWNNLLEPMANKSTSWAPVFQNFLCPTAEKPYITTRENSNEYNKIL